jgi:hypothetical protein
VILDAYMINRTRFLSDFPRALSDDCAALFVGAGISAGAGYPAWAKLLHEIGEELGVRSTDVHDLAALAQWSIRKSNKSRILQVIKDQIGVDKPVPEVLQIVARLPIRNIWTTNYDRLIERALEAIGRPVDVVSAASDLALRPRPGAVRLFKMHGSVERPNEIVIATDDYELYRLKRGAFLPLLQAHMTSLSLLFLGLSFADPNIKHVLALIRESFHETPPQHFAIVRPPQREDFDSDAEHQARLAQHQYWAEDLLRYGLHVVEIDSYDEVPKLMHAVERAVAKNKIWISGSWPLEGDPDKERYVSQIASALGAALAEEGFTLVTGAGLRVGSASLSGFLDGLRRTGAWDLERRLIARPFPQSPNGEPQPAHWAAIRAELAQLSGAAVIVGGLRAGGQRADGVFAECDAALHAGSLVVPVACTGGAAAEIARNFKSSNLSTNQGTQQRPTDAELDALAQEDSPDAVAARIIEVLKRVLRQ